MERTKQPKHKVFQQLVDNPYLIVRELNNRSFYCFVKYFWDEISEEPFQTNWHIKYLCKELQKVAENLGKGNKKLYDIIANVPPGSSKTSIVSILFPVWCWTRWIWMKFICLSYSATLSLESAETSRDIVRSDKFQTIYPEIKIKRDKDNKSNFRVESIETVHLGFAPRRRRGGNRLSTSVKGTVTGFHAHFILWDDPLNPQQAISVVELKGTNRWMDQTLSTRKVDKEKSVSIGIMQRLHENDTTAHLLKKKGKYIKHICIPGEILTKEYAEKVRPRKLVKKYKNGLMDPVRLSKGALKELEADLGQYGYAGQVGQSPTPPKGGMFKVENAPIIDQLPAEVNIVRKVRYWDKAGTKEQLDPNKNNSAYTCGTKIYLLKSGKWIIADVKRGRWEAVEREKVILSTAHADGKDVEVWYEQEPGSGGKESAQATTRMLAGFKAEAECPKGDKVYRADPYSVQWNDGNIMILRGDWNHEFIEEHRFFPFSKFKDQVDSAGAGFAKLTSKKRVKIY